MKIENYRFGEITIDGRKYSSDVILFSDRVIQWWRQEGHIVDPSDLQEIASLRPEVLVIGTGAHGVMRVLPEVESFLSSHGIKLIVLPTSEACEKYNQLQDKHRVAVALHLTC